MFSLALANTTQSSPFIQLLPLVLIFVVFYFLLIRPQRRKMKDHRLMVQNLKVGDTVITSGGIIGIIVKMKDTKLLLNTNNIELLLDKGSISSLLPLERAKKPNPPKPQKTSPKSKKRK